jgi:hypothetical protein
VLNYYKSILRTARNHKSFFKKAALAILLIIYSILNYGQAPLQDSALQEQATNNVIVLYKNAMKENLRLYNGREYLYSGHNAKGFPYFKSNDILNGTVMYDENIYTNVPMYYDLVNDELVIRDYTQNFPIKLLTEKIKYFVIDGNKFINSATDTAFTAGLAKGFYEELYHNKVLVFAKKQKIVRQKTSSEGSEFSYKEFDTYFIYYNGKIDKVSSEKSVLNVFKKKKNELRKFINTNKLRFKKDFEEAIVKTARYFDEIEN